MKLQAGKFYKTRSGSIAYIAATRSPFQHTDKHDCVIGWLLCVDDKEATSQAWLSDGRFREGNVPVALDLVAEHLFECKEGCGPCAVDMFTPINREGPYCPECLAIKTAVEADDNSAFGLGA
jgi:hypothetical protein